MDDTICNTHNGIGQVSRKEYLFLRAVFWFSITSFFVLVAVAILIASYPFKTLDISEPIQIVNPDKRVPLGGVVEMQVDWIKYINNPGIVSATLLRKSSDCNELIIVASTSWISSRKHGVGSHIRNFYVPYMPIAVGKDCFINLAVQYELYGFRPVLREFKSELFEIYDSAKETGR